MSSGDPARAVTRALVWRVGALVVGVAVVAALLFTLLARLHYANVNARLTAERLAVLASRSVAPFAAAARLGLPLDTVRNAAGLLERARLADDAIVALVVVGADGRVVHAVGEAPGDGAPLAAWRRAREAAGGRDWHLTTHDRLVAGTDIRGPDGHSAGSLIVVYPTAGERQLASAMGADLIGAALLAVAAAVAGAALMVRPALAETLDELRRLAAAHAAFQRGEWRGWASETEVADAAGHPLVADLQAAVARYRAAASPEDRS